VGKLAGAYLPGMVMMVAEMNPAILQNQFVQVALPIMFTVLIAAWMNGKGLDGVKGRLDDIVARLGRIEGKLEGHDERIVRLEERTSPLTRR
jgi:hypothetical protein